MRRTTEKEAEQKLYRELLFNIYEISNAATLKKSEVKKLMEVFKRYEED